MGLARDRNERPVSVSEWFAGMDPGRAPARGLTSRPRVTVEHTHENKGLPLAVVVPLVGLLVIVSVLSSIRSRTPDTSAHVEGSSIDAPAVAQTPIAARIASPPTQPDATPPPVSASTQSAPSKPREELDAPRKIGGLVLPGRTYYVQPRQDFAEIRVRRSSGSEGDAHFNWWTESASAMPGIDFVPQNPVTRSFAAGANTASLFVKVLPNSSRPQPEKFYVDVAGSSTADSSPAVERVAVVLPKTP
jgi:hypothetical protein